MQKTSLLLIILGSFLILKDTVLWASGGFATPKRSTSQLAIRTPDTRKENKREITVKLPQDSELRIELQKVDGFKTDEAIEEFFCTLDINATFTHLWFTDEAFKAKSIKDKKEAIWDDIKQKTIETGFTQATGITVSKRFKGTIRYLVNTITRRAFDALWQEGNWETVVSSTPNTNSVSGTTGSDLLDNKESSKKTGAGAATGEAGAPKRQPKAPVNNKKDSAATDDLKKPSNISEYRKTILAGTALIAVSVWLYSKYSHSDVQKSIHAGTAA